MRGVQKHLLPSRCQPLLLSTPLLLFLHLLLLLRQQSLGSEEESTTSPAAPAKECVASRGKQSPEERRTVRSLLCGQGSARWPSHPSPVWCGLSQWSVVRCVHLTGTGASRSSVP